GTCPVCEGHRLICLLRGWEVAIDQGRGERAVERGSAADREPAELAAVGRAADVDDEVAAGSLRVVAADGECAAAAKRKRAAVTDGPVGSKFAATLEAQAAGGIYAAEGLQGIGSAALLNLRIGRI